MSTPIVEKKTGISPVWILPLLALCVGGWLLYKSNQDIGVEITLHTKDAVGITEGKTPVIFKGGEIGKVKKIETSSDLQKVLLTIEMDKNIEPHLVEDVSFWVEKAAVEAGRVTGLETLLSGSYIGMQLGSSDASCRTFIALPHRPPVAGNAPGLHLTLQADFLYSVQVGSGIYHKSVMIGTVQSYKLNDMGKVSINIHIKPEYARLIKEGSRFWNVSGIEIKGGISDLKVHIASLAAIIKGGIAVATPDSLTSDPPATNGQIFTLFEDADSAKYGINLNLELITAEGLREGVTRLIYRGMDVGVVQRITINRNAKHTVTASVLLDPRASVILKSGTKFFLVKPEVSLKGVQNLDTLIDGTYITFIPGDGKRQDDFVVYEENPGDFYAKEHADGQIVKLLSVNSGSIAVGSPILYKKISVGKITNFTLREDSDDVLITGVVSKKYARLLRRNSLFYNASGIRVTAGLESGLKLQTDSLESIVAGGVSFYTPEKGKRAPDKHVFTLYDDLTAAQQSDRKKVIIHFKESVGLKPGVQVKYNGNSIGQVTKLKYENKMTTIRVEAMLDKEAEDLLRAGTQFWLVRPEFSLAGTQHLDTLVAGPYIAVEPGGGKLKTEFNAVNEAQAQAKRRKGLRIILETDDLHSVQVGSPIYYRHVQVGKVVDFELSPTFQKVFLQTVIYEEFKPLIRENTKFWDASGIQVSGGIFSGLSVSTESMDALMTGGITLATPEGEKMGGFVTAGQHFMLYGEAEEHWTEWSPNLGRNDSNQQSPLQ